MWIKEEFEKNNILGEGASYGMKIQSTFAINFKSSNLKIIPSYFLKYYS